MQHDEIMNMEKMMVMEQLLQLYEGLHETVRRNSMIVEVVYAGFWLLALITLGLCFITQGKADIPGGVPMYYPLIGVGLIALQCCISGGLMIKRLKDESKEAKSTLKGVVVMIHEYRQLVLPGISPVFLKAVDMRLVRI